MTYKHVPVCDICGELAKPCKQHRDIPTVRLRVTWPLPQGGEEPTTTKDVDVCGTCVINLRICEALAAAQKLHAEGASA